MSLRGNGLARAAVRFKPSSFVGTFVALAMAAFIVSACGILLETGARASVPPVRYAGAPVVVAADQQARLTVGHGEERHVESAQVPDRAFVDAELAGRLSGVPGAARAVADVSFPVRVGDAAGVTAHGWGSAAFTGVHLAEGVEPRPGEAVLDRAAAQAADAAVGDTVRVATADGGRDVRVAGLAGSPGAGADGPAVWLPDAEAAALAGHGGRVDAIAVLPAKGTSTPELADAVKAAVGGRALVHTGDDRGAVEDPGLAGAREVLTGLGGSFGGIATMVAVFTAAGTVALCVNQRAREFALLRAIGATPRQIRRSIATEALLVAPLAGALGCLPGIGLAAWWFGQLKDRGAVPAAVDLHVSFIPLVSAIGLGLLTALCAGRLAARRPARIKPGQALTEASLERLRPGVVRTVLGVGALVGGGFFAVLAASSAGDDAAEASLGVVMLFMLAVALLGPLLARLCAALFGVLLR
ncbi:ABC transporter permease, partial [Streptomyces sp. NPDC051940]|uniref:ABC transporter permease n=1 Tax=Streptomyces sp. NPDC051940 TaxID=3155675 RepID=UPI003430AC86